MKCYMARLFSRFVALLALLIAVPASAQVILSFQSFNGSMFGGRYPHTFIVLEGTLESTGQKIDENYGFSARSASPAVLAGPVRHMILVEEPEWIPKTNRHFSVPISDAQYYEIVAEVTRWRDAPGKYYDLNKRNCIHFVGRMGELVGLKVDYPKKMLRKPRAWLNHIATLNPQLGARQL
ncbi:MAG: hypothetical protein ACK5NN_03530 [Sphingomonadaceae bacterium]